MSEPPDQNGHLRHVEWDSWGFAGTSDTVVYLVFDPTDSLIDASRSGQPIKHAGLPCKVARVRRLEKNWYTVRFYADSDWSRCEL